MADFIVVDVGTSFIKAAVADVDSLALRLTVRAPFPEFLSGLPPLYCEADPGAVMNTVEDLLAHLMPHASCEGILLCGQMHGFVLVGGAGEPVSNYISWLDQRVSRAEFEEMAAQVTEKERNELGNEFRASIALALLHWMRRHGTLPAGEVTPVSIADFVAARLCGTRPVMEPTQAAAFGALRLGDLGWHKEVIGKLGLDSLRWPEVRQSGSVAGAWCGIPCYTALGDQQCALAGALLAEGELSVNVGTGSQVAIITGTVQPGGHQTRPYFDGRFLSTITHIPGGRALSALIGLLTELGGATEDEAWRKIEAAVAAVPATDLRAGIAFYPGPCGQAGFLENLHEGNLGIGHVFRAVFESMAVNYATCARRIDPGRNAAKVVFSGGVARRLPVLRQLTAAALNLPHRLSPHPEDTLFGLMVLARAFSGRNSSVRSATAAAAQFLG